MPKKKDKQPKTFRDVPLPVYLTDEEAEIISIIGNFLNQSPSAIATVAVERLLVAFKPIAFAINLVEAVDKCKQGIVDLRDKNKDLTCYLDEQYHPFIDRLNEMGMKDLVEDLLGIYEFIDTTVVEEIPPKTKQDIMEDIIEGLKNWKEPDDTGDTDDDATSTA